MSAGRGAGSADGIGFAVARELAARGATVVVGSTTDRINQRVAELAATGATAMGFIGDLTDPDLGRRVIASLY